MVNRDDFSIVTLGSKTYFVVPDPLKPDFVDFCAQNPQYKFCATGETGSHVAWDYTEYASTSSAAEQAIEFLSGFEF